MTEHPRQRPDDAGPHESTPEGTRPAPEQAPHARSPRPARLTDDDAAGLPPQTTGAVAAGRYASRSRLSRTTQVRLAVAAVTVAVLSIAWIAMGPNATTVRGKEFGYSVQGPESVDITFDVSKPKASTVRCTVEALSENFAQVGTKEVVIGPAEVGEARYTTTIATTELAVTAIVDECVLVD